MTAKHDDDRWADRFWLSQLCRLNAFHNRRYRVQAARLRECENALAWAQHAYDEQVKRTEFAMRLVVQAGVESIEDYLWGEEL
jgi:hydrogenase maturation factor HypF (carbamoyltransferase family)